MLEPIDLMVAVHTLCEETLIPNKISPPHPQTIHAPTTALYAQAINDAGLDVTPQEVVKAIIKAANWDMNSPWKGHPFPEKVIKVLGDK